MKNQCGATRLFVRLLIAVILAFTFGLSAPTYAAITFFASASNPADNGALTDSVAQPVTPPVGMQSGDFVYLIAIVRSPTATLSVANTGGQSWTVKNQQGVNGQAQTRVWL